MNPEELIGKRIKLQHQRKHEGVLKRIVKAGEELSVDEVKMYYGERIKRHGMWVNMPAGWIKQLVKVNAHRAMILKDNTFYLIVPFKEWRYDEVNDITFLG